MVRLYATLLSLSVIFLAANAASVQGCVLISSRTFWTTLTINFPLFPSSESYFSGDLEARSTYELLDELYQRGFFDEELRARNDIVEFESDLEERDPFFAAFGKIFQKIFRYAPSHDSTSSR